MANIEEYRSNIIGGCRYIAEQYAMSQVRPTECDTYTEQKRMLDARYPVVPARQFITSNTNSMEDMIYAGDLCAGLIFMDVYSSDEKAANRVIENYLSEDNEVSLYEFLRRALKNDTVSKKYFDNRAKVLVDMIDEGFLSAKRKA